MPSEGDVGITPAQARMARAAMRWTLDDVAEISRMGRATISRFETEVPGFNLKVSTRAHLRRTYERFGVQFFFTEHGGGVKPPVQSIAHQVHSE